MYKEIGAKVINGSIIDCGWMLVEKDEELFIIDAKLNKVINCPIDSYLWDASKIMIWACSHTWLYTYMGDLIIEGELPHSIIEDYHYKNSRRFDKEKDKFIYTSELVDKNDNVLFHYESIE